MPFGNSWSEEFETDGALPRLVLLKSRPPGDRAADGSGATAWMLAWPCDVTASPLQKAFGQLLFLAWA